MAAHGSVDIDLISKQININIQMETHVNNHMFNVWYLEK